MVLWKTLEMIIAIMSISEYANSNGISVLFIGWFVCIMYNFFSWMEHLPKVDKPS